MVKFCKSNNIEPKALNNFDVTVSDGESSDTKSVTLNVSDIDETGSINPILRRDRRGRTGGETGRSIGGEYLQAERQFLDH